MSKPEITTFGCRLNIFESEIMRGHAERAGLDDVVIIHSCAVTAEAERQVRQSIRRAKRNHPDKRLIVTGCAVQIEPEAYQAMDEVDHIIGNTDKLKPASWQALAHHVELPEVADIMAVRETAPHLVDGFDGKTRAYLQVQNGCDHRCTFCIIPYGRGNSRSVPTDRIVAQAQLLCDAGYAEIVITGVDITSYGKELPGTPTLGSMLKALLASVPDLPRLRLSSIDPAEIDDDLWDLIRDEPRLMPHLHLSMQAGSDMILKRMKRRHSRDGALELTQRLREFRPDLALGADLIAGFPTETDQMFEDTRRFVEQAGLVHLHVFPYSTRPGTPAARMPPVAKNVRKQRAKILRETGRQVRDRYLKSLIGTPQRVLIERGGKGLGENFVACRIEDHPPFEPGTIVTMTPNLSDDGMLAGRWIKTNHPAKASPSEAA